MGYAERRNRYQRRAWLFYWFTAPKWEKVLCWVAWVWRWDWKQHFLILKKEGLR